MGNIASPVLALLDRLEFHRATGYSAPVVKLLEGVKIYTDPTARADDDQDLPNLMVHVPNITDTPNPGRMDAGFSLITVQIDLASNKKFGWHTAVSGKLGFMDLVEKFMSACFRNNLGHPDRYLDATVSKQIAITISDGVASDQSITASAVVTLHSKAYQ